MTLLSFFRRRHSKVRRLAVAKRWPGRRLPVDQTGPRRRPVGISQPIWPPVNRF